MKTIVFISFFALLGFSCTSDNKVKEPIFFDLKNYFEQEIIRLKKETNGIKKTITSKERTESKVLKTVNWSDEFALFAKSAINKPAWQDKYKITKLDLKPNRQITEYTAKDPSLYTQRIDIEWQDDQIHSITIINAIENQIYESQQFLTYNPAKGYSIKKIQNVKTLGADDYEIEVQFIEK